MLRHLRAQVARRVLRLALAADATGQQRGTPPDLRGTVEVETSFGSLYLPDEDAFITPYLRQHGVWEPEETKLFSRTLRPGQTFVDVGAHVGYFSCLAGRLVGPRGLVLAFEPHPRNHELLLANVWRNGLTNVVVFPWAVTDSNGFADLFAQKKNTGGHLLYPWPDETEEVLRVRTVALDQVVAIRPPLEVVKVDAQGTDDLAVRGMAGLLAASPRATVLVEFWPFGMRLREAEPRGALDFYRALGYRIAVQLPNEPGEARRLSDDEILDYCAGEGGMLHVNLLLERTFLRRSG
jgi:FkbM family methyltransferase